MLKQVLEIIFSANAASNLEKESMHPEIKLHFSYQFSNIEIDH